MTPSLPGPLDALVPSRGESDADDPDTERPDGDRRQQDAAAVTGEGATAVTGEDATATGDGTAVAAATTAADPLVDVRDLTVSYGESAVLEGVSLSVAPGEFVGVVGRNGAGKTTLLKAINGVLDPDSGTVRVAGERVHDLSARAASRRVATVPQDTTVAFDFSVADVVAMGRTPYHGRLSGDPDGAAAVERAMERTETAQFRDRSVGSLSGGERQRVVLARALAQAAPALVLDEPTASLDVNHQVRTLALVADLAAEGTAALAAIHDLDLAARFCDRIAVLADGGLLAVGPPADVLTDAHVRTAFDAEAAVLSNPVTGTPTVTPLAPANGSGLDCRVHVAGGGPVAARTVATLAAAGATVTAGVLPEGDVAATTARDLGVDVVTAPAFSPVEAAVEAAARDSLASADAAVLAGTAPPSVRALVRDHDRLVRVTRDGSAPDPAGDGLSVVATGSPASVLDAVRRALEDPVAAE